MNKRFLGALVGTATLGAALLGCGEPSGVVSPNGQTWTVTFTRDFQLQTGEPLVRADALCNGASSWSHSSWFGFNANSAPTVALSVYCPTGVLSGSWTSTHS